MHPACVTESEKYLHMSSCECHQTVLVTYKNT